MPLDPDQSDSDDSTTNYLLPFPRVDSQSDDSSEAESNSNSSQTRSEKSNANSHESRYNQSDTDSVDDKTWRHFFECAYEDLSKRLLESQKEHLWKECCQIMDRSKLLDKELRAQLAQIPVLPPISDTQKQNCGVKMTKTTIF